MYMNIKKKHFFRHPRQRMSWAFFMRQIRNSHHNPQNREGSNKGISLSGKTQQVWNTTSASLTSSDILTDNKSLKIMKI